jgi:hypothetical protein
VPSTLRGFLSHVCGHTTDLGRLRGQVFNLHPPPN